MTFRRITIVAAFLTAALVFPNNGAAQGQGPSIQRLPSYPAEPIFGLASDLHFPSLPPQPEELPDEIALPLLEDELWQHGGSYLYQPEGDRLNWPSPSGVGPTEHEALLYPDQRSDDYLSHYKMLRLPEHWQAPQPITLFADYLGADPIRSYPFLKWPGEGGYHWEPRVVVAGGYQMFAIAQHANSDDQFGVGHQLLLDIDFRLTGTERFHIQFRPLGEHNTGGSFWKFSQPSGYIDNSTAEPERFWFEGEVASIFGAWIDPFAVRDIHFAIGKYPFALHNELLINDDVLGVIVGKNTIYGGMFSNLNIQAFYAFQEVDTFTDSNAELAGLHFTADMDHDFYEATYVFLANQSDSNRDAHYVALSRTAFYGMNMVAARGMAKLGDAAGSGDGWLFVLESNRHVIFDHPRAGIDHAVFYANSFSASSGWNSISGGSYDRLRSSFEVNPLVAVSSNRRNVNTWGTSLGVQLFRHHDDESFVPEIAFESRGGEAVWGLGMRYLRKTSSRSYFEVLGVMNLSNDPTHRRNGVFVAETILF